MVGEQQVRAQALGPVQQPVVQQRLELRVQRNERSVCILPTGDTEPVGRADLHDRVDGEAEHLAAAPAGAGKDLDGQPGERIGILAGGGQQLGGRRVVEEARQRFVSDREIAVEHQLAGRPVDGVPLVQAVEESPEFTQSVADSVPVQRSSAGGRPLQQPLHIAFDVPPPELRDTGHDRVFGGDQQGELSQRQLSVLHGARPQCSGDLPQVVLHRVRHPGRDTGPLPGPHVGPGPASDDAGAGRSTCGGADVRSASVVRFASG
ncbi:hypothetical protein OOK27_47420 [Streptomyces canus]|uniref:hypothetical protein n=1 Tax=Streptomyces canus TaxID=58343 RepID=UPI00224CB323|nr:hypothetical protein [Streptomyces canus]MCX5261685.1 hypothetical protein [Streptomyces canus]